MGYTMTCNALGVLCRHIKCLREIIFIESNISSLLGTIDLPAFKQIESFSLVNCKPVGDNTFLSFFFGHSYFLKYLNLSGNAWLKSVIKQSVMFSSKSLVKVERLNLSNCAFGNEDIKDLVQFILMFDSLKIIKLTRNNFSLNEVKTKFIKSGGSEEVQFVMKQSNTELTISNDSQSNENHLSKRQ